MTLTIDSLHGLLGERQTALWRGNLSRIDWERDFVAHFRSDASSGRYLGLGKSLLGISHAARHSGPAAAALADRIFAATIACQHADGYLGLNAEADRTCRTWDVHEQAYLIHALVEDGLRRGRPEELAAAARLGRWLLPRLAGGAWRRILHGKTPLWTPLTTIGLVRALRRLGEATGDGAFVACCRDELEIRAWSDPIVEGRQGGVAGHAYAYIERSLAQLEMLPAGHPLPAAAQAIGGFLRSGGLFISGTTGVAECWTCDQDGSGKTGETCTTVYLILWALHLLRRTGDAWYGDLAERAWYNALIAAGSEDGRRIRYYTAVDGPRTWYEHDFYCCPGNYRRLIGELADHLVHVDGDRLDVCLYEACRFTVGLSGRTLGLRLDSGLPDHGRVVLTVESGGPAAATIRLRLPAWCADPQVAGPTGEPGDRSMPGWVAFTRAWRAGDRITLDLPMAWRLVRGMRSRRGRTALMRGPQIWSIDAGAEAEPEPLASGVFDPSSLTPGDDPRRWTASLDFDGRQRQVGVVPFTRTDHPLTYLYPVSGAATVNDHLLWIGSDPPGTGKAPGT